MDTQSLPVKATPYQHQREACSFACGLFGLDGETQGCSCALLMEMGTGKTLTAIAVAGRLYLTGKARRALIVAPLSIVGVWQEEFARYAAFDHTITIVFLSSRRRTSCPRRKFRKSARPMASVAIT